MIASTLIPLLLCFLLACVVTAVAVARRRPLDPLSGQRRHGDLSAPRALAAPRRDDTPSREQLSDARVKIATQLDELRLRSRDSVGGAGGPPDYHPLVAELEGELRDIDALLGTAEEPASTDLAAHPDSITDGEKAWLRSNDADRRLSRRRGRSHDAMNATLAAMIRRVVRVVSICCLVVLLVPLLYRTNWSTAFAAEIGRAILILLILNVGVSAFAWLLRDPATDAKRP